MLVADPGIDVCADLGPDPDLVLGVVPAGSGTCLVADVRPELRAERHAHPGPPDVEVIDDAAADPFRRTGHQQRGAERDGPFQPPSNREDLVPDTQLRAAHPHHRPQVHGGRRLICVYGRAGGWGEGSVFSLKVDPGEDIATDIARPAVVCGAAGIEDLAIVVRSERPAREIKGHTGHRRVRVNGRHRWNGTGSGWTPKCKPSTLVDYEAGDLEPHGAKRAADHSTVNTATTALVQEPGSTEDPALVEEQADRTKRVGLPADAPLQIKVAKVEVGAVERNPLNPTGGRGCAKVGDLPVCAHSQSHHSSSIRRLAGEGQQRLAPRAGAANAAN